MNIKAVYLENYRNIEKLEIRDLNSGINIFTGDNAQGKTNLIEAINYLSCAKSFRGASDEALIMYDKPKSELSLDYAAKYYSGRIDAVLFKNKKRAVSMSGVPVKRIADMIGRINTVVFAPEDIRTIKDRPQQRRRLIDIEISKIKPTYYSVLQQYNSVLKNKSRLLKEEADETLIDVYNEQLIKFAQEITERRTEFINAVEKLCEKIHADLTDRKEHIDISYRRCAEDCSLETLKRKAEALLPKEKLYKMCLFGPQREDIELFINGRSLKSEASQGQQRTAMISLKLAFAQIAEAETGERPILLLDDVLSELDSDRRTRLLFKIQNSQVFITATEIGKTEGLEGAKLFKVSQGCFFNI